MAAEKKRFMVSVAEPVERALGLLAERDQTPRATKAAQLIELALELEEDVVLDQLAGERDLKSARFVSHKNAWQ